MQFEVKGVEIKSSRCMKILGVFFDSQLKWGHQVESVIVSGKRIIQGLKVLRNKYRDEHFLHIVNAQFFTKIYNASTVWLGHSMHKDKKE